MERIKSILQIVTLLVALFQLIVSDSRRAEENVANAAQIMKLSECVQEQNAYIEAAYRGGEGGAE